MSDRKKSAATVVKKYSAATPNAAKAEMAKERVAKERVAKEELVRGATAVRNAGRSSTRSTPAASAIATSNVKSKTPARTGGSKPAAVASTTTKRARNGAVSLPSSLGATAARGGRIAPIEIESASPESAAPARTIRKASAADAAVTRAAKAPAKPVPLSERPIDQIWREYRAAPTEEIRNFLIARHLDLVGTHVFFNDGWIPYDERAGYLLEADVGVSTHLDHVETAFSFRTRILDYLWAALPVVATAGDALGDLVAARGFGVAVAPGDADALADALHGLLTDPVASRACRDAITVARADLAWSRAAAPLVAMAARPQRAADLVDPRERAVRGDRVAAAVWGVGWEASARGAWASLRRGEWDDLADKVQRRWSARP